MSTIAGIENIVAVEIELNNVLLRHKFIDLFNKVVDFNKVYTNPENNQRIWEVRVVNQSNIYIIFYINKDEFDKIKDILLNDFKGVSLSEVRELK